MTKQGKKPKQELLLILVEGESDRIALENPLNQFLDMNGIDVKIKFCHLYKDKEGNDVSGGDTTSDYGIYQGNFDEEISKRIMRELTILEGIYPKYITKVIQIADTDGAFVPEEYVVNDDSCEHVKYEENVIRTNNVDGIVKRNNKKSAMLSYLSMKDKIKLKTTTVDYSIYFFSCNIDHFLADDRNMPGCYKKSNAAEFQGMCLDDEKFFTKTLVEGPYVAKDMSYRESWQYVKKGSNSLSRFSNINLMIDDILSWYSRRNVEALC